MDNQNENNQSENMQADNGTVELTLGKNRISCLTVIGEIEGHTLLPSTCKTTKYEHVIPSLVCMEENESVEGLIVLINTVGGDVEAGLAIAELIAGMKKPTVSLVLGGGHSIGVPLAVSAKRSFIVPSATMTVHPVRTSGLVLGVPQAFDYLERMQQRIVNFVTTNSKISSNRFNELMMNVGQMANDIGTILDGTMAVNEGLIDELGGLCDALTALNKMIDNNRRVNR